MLLHARICGFLMRARVFGRFPEASSGFWVRVVELENNSGLH